MSDDDVLAACLRAFPGAYRMGAHDTNVCLAAASRLSTHRRENAPSSATSPCERCGGRGGEGSGERNPGTDVWLICQACHGSGVTPTEKAGER